MRAKPRVAHMSSWSAAEWRTQWKTKSSAPRRCRVFQRPRGRRASPRRRRSGSARRRTARARTGRSRPPATRGRRGGRRTSRGRAREREVGGRRVQQAVRAGGERGAEVPAGRGAERRDGLQVGVAQQRVDGDERPDVEAVCVGALVCPTATATVPGATNGGVRASAGAPPLTARTTAACAIASETSCHPAASGTVATTVRLTLTQAVPFRAARTSASLPEQSRRRRWGFDPARAQRQTVKGARRPRRRTCGDGAERRVEAEAADDLRARGGGQDGKGLRGRRACARRSRTLRGRTADCATAQTTSRASGDAMASERRRSASSAPAREKSKLSDLKKNLFE